MKKILINIALLLSVSLLTLVGCSTNTRQQNTGIGAVSGAVLGGLAGSAIGGGTGQVVAVAAGAIAGALLGGYIGHSMDSTDNQRVGSTMNNPTNHTTTWRNSKTGNRYSVTPTSNTMSYNGNNYCRKFTATAVISGKKRVVNGVACRQSDGTWRTVNS